MELRVSLLSACAEAHALSQAIEPKIIANSAFIGLQVDYGEYDEKRSIFLAISAVFCAVFSAELLLRVVAFGTQFFTHEPAWNFFDGVVVLCSIVELVLSLSLADLSLFRTLRVLRFVRVARVLRVVQFFRELRLMVFSILHSTTSLVWAIGLLLTITFMFGIIFTQAVREVNQGELDQLTFDELQRLFGSLHRTMVTLCQAVLGGFSWASLSDLLLEVHYAYELLFCGFIAFTALALLNVVTGVFVDGAMRSASDDRDVIIQDQMAQESSYAQSLRRLFMEADADNTGLLTLDEFQDYLKDQRVLTYLHALGIHTSEAAGLFNLLDLDSKGTVNVDEFMVGCLRLRGEAKGIDIATLMYENKRMVTAIMSALQHIEGYVGKDDTSVGVSRKSSFDREKRLSMGSEGSGAATPITAAWRHRRSRG